MFIACWSVKGGSGTTVIAASLAVLASRDEGIGGRRRRAASTRRGFGSLLVDLAGDVPAAIGAPEPAGPGVSDWLRAGVRVPVDGWGRLEVAAAPGLSFVPRGRGALVDEERAEVLAGVLDADGRVVVVDCGVLGGGSAPRLSSFDPTVVRATSASSSPEPRSSPSSDASDRSADVPGSGTTTLGLEPAAGAPWPEDLDARVPATGTAEVPLVLAAEATVSLLVIRPCYLALRRAAAAPITPSGVVVVHEPGRSLDSGDVEDVLGVPVVAEVPYDPAVARAVDSGFLLHRLPRGLERSLRDAA